MSYGDYVLLVSFIFIVSVVITIGVICSKQQKQHSEAKENPNKNGDEADSLNNSNVVYVGSFSNELTKIAIQRAIIQKEKDAVAQVLAMQKLDEKLLKHGEEILSNKE